MPQGWSEWEILHSKATLDMAILLPLSYQKKKKVMLTTLCSVNPILVVENRTQSNASNISPTNLRSLCDQGRLREALDTLHLVDSLFNSSAYVLLLQACIKKKALAEAKLIHSHINQTGFVPDRYLLHTLMNMYAKCRRLVDARRIFDQMPVRDAFSWSLMIAAYARQGPAEEALALFRQIQRAGVQPDVFIFASVIPACSTLDELKDVHKEIISNGFQLDVFVGSTLLDMYAKRGSLEDARDVFEKMPQRDVVSWNSMIAAYVKEGLYEEALELFYQMQRTGMCPSEFTFASVLPACANLTALAQGMEIHGGIIRSGIHCDTFVANALVDMYAKCGSIEKARDVFDRMRQRDVVSWTSMIAGYAQHGYSEAALKLFQKMRLAGVKPNSKTFASVIPACANLANLEKGMEIDGELTGSGYQSDLVVTNALINMYAKCGILEKARQLFDGMLQRDVVSWTAMIAGYALNGCGKETLTLFHQMKQSGINPNHVTFVCVLTACCHAGLVDEGQYHFKCMSEYYHITPTMKHYTCMVDLLGRAGRLDEAEEFISKIPIKPDATVWECLLGACRLHNNIELGERVAKYLFELDPKIDAPYVLLSNIYSAAGRWDDIDKVRKMMRDRGVQKTPGCSWIEINKQVHAFLVGNRPYPESENLHLVGEVVHGNEDCRVSSQ